MISNNPAGRLHAILMKCKQQANRRGNNGLEIWPSILGLPNDAPIHIVMGKLAELYALPAQVEAEILSFSDLDPELFLGWRRELSEALANISLRGQYGGFVDGISDTLLLAINFCSHELAKRRPDKVIDETELEELRMSIQDLCKQVIEAKLDEQISRYMLNHLYDLLGAIENYQFSGVQGIEHALDSVVGSVITSSETAKAVQESPLGDAFWGTVGKTAVLLQLAQSATQLGSDLLQLLP